MTKYSSEIRNIGILAHVDAGKTTVTENLLYLSGSIRALGSVDKGTAHTDNLEIERERGISVKAAEAVLAWRGIQIHIIDTPGHVDFVAEVERSLSVLDGAVLVISAVEGVQPQTEVYFKALKEMKIPTVIFINKVDRIGSDVKRVLKEIGKLLTDSAIPVETLVGEETTLPEVLPALTEIEDEYGKQENAEVINGIVEIMADKDEEILSRYLEGDSIPMKLLMEKFITLVQQSDIYPVLFGTALKGIGIKELLEALVNFLPAPAGDEKGKLSAVIFRVQQHKTLGKLAFVRLFSGTIKSRELIYNKTKDIQEKVALIKKLSFHRELDTAEIRAGEIGAVAGLTKAGIGDILGSDAMVPKVPSLAVPLLTLKVTPKLESQYMEFVEAFQQLEEEDPTLKVLLIREKRELHINIMGMIQLEILESIMKNRFGIEVNFGKPAVIYKETPSKKGTGFAAYTMPKPCWAINRFEIEPLGKGAGIVYESRVRTEDIKLRYQREIEKAIPKALEQGLYGWEVIDLKVTLIEGQDHVMHSNPGDFMISTPMAVMDALTVTGTTLLEPYIYFRISVPEDISGKVLGDITQMRGNFETPSIIDGRFIVEGEVPAATSLDYPVRLGIISGGKGIITTRFSDYRPCPLELGAVRERTGIDPRDRAKFILHMRNAL